MDTKIFKFKKQSEVTSSTYVFSRQYDHFERNYPLSQDFIQNCYFNAKEIKSELKSVNALNIPFGRTAIKLVKNPQSDNDLSYRRFFAYLATMAYRKELDIINPLAESLGIYKETGMELSRKAYFGCTPGAYMNVDDFGIIPSVFEFKRLQDADPREMEDLFQYYGKTLRVKGTNGQSVSNLLSITDNISEAQSVLQMLDSGSVRGSKKIIAEAKRMFAKVSEELSNYTETD